MVFEVSNDIIPIWSIGHASRRPGDWKRRRSRRSRKHVLMTNHFHIFLKITDLNLSTGRHALESGDATLFNKRHGRSDAVFQGRFLAVLVESAGQAWSLSRPRVYSHEAPTGRPSIRCAGILQTIGMVSE